MLTTIANYNLDHLLPDEYMYLVSLEMTKASLVDRITSARAKMNSVLFRTPASLSRTQWSELFNVGQFLGDKLFLTYDKHALPEHIWSNVLSQRAKGKRCRVVLIDFLQLMASARVRKMKMREDELRHAVASTLSELTDMAKELGCPIIVAAQVNRDPERLRPERPVPTMFNIAESANAEQACDIGLLLYRHHRFHPMSACHTEAEIHLGKMRNGGGIGVLPATYTGQYALFSDRKASCECPHCQLNARKALQIAPASQLNLRGVR
jgi:replicative DNA helicase